MSRIHISSNHKNFEKNGKPFFMMADTCWSAFTNMTLQEFERYLKLRKEQGFNTIFIDILPQWDRGMKAGESACPFVAADAKELRLSDVPDAYLENICNYLALMNQYDMTPILVVLWSNYTKGTLFDGLWGNIPMRVDDVEDYAKKVAGMYKEYEPLYFISGDSDFSEAVVDAYYLPALKAVKAADPDALVSFHCCGDGCLTTEELEQSIPARFLYSELVDFYCFQSGHFSDWLDRCGQVAKAYRGLKVRKPVINSEPCYEGWDCDNESHDRNHMRQSTWLSILSGADAGLAYGAQGVWQWYHEGDFFAPCHYQGDLRLLYECEQPFTGWQAMAFEGVADRVFARTIVETYGIYDVVPDLRVEAATDMTRLATCSGGAQLLLYMPRNQYTKVGIPADGLTFDLYDLKQREKIDVPLIVTEDGFDIDYPGVNSDLLLVGYRKN